MILSLVWLSFALGLFLAASIFAAITGMISPWLLVIVFIAIATWAFMCKRVNQKFYLEVKND